MPDPGNHEQPASELEIADILDGYRQELQDGDDPDPEACLGAHPELASELADCLQGLAAMEELRDALHMAPVPAPFAPRSLGDFQLVREIGRGGMGVVYEAIDSRLKRTVALKRIKAGILADGQELEMFRKEARAAASLQHPNIVQLHEVGEDEGQPYLVLEYVDGGSLETKLAGTPIDPYEAAKLLATLAQAMQYAHAHGIIHRDLKPANILLTQNGIPKITDFGLAKHVHADAGQTQSGTIKGTASYMASEQASGGTTNALTDVYALGAILYETLTGRPPFRGATPLDTLMQVTSLEPVAPSRLQPKVPRDLETICLKCLQKEPHKRYGSAQELADELGRFQRHEPIRARPVGVSGRAWRWCRRNPVVAGLGATAALLLMAVTVLATAHLVGEATRRSEIERSLPVAAKDRARTILLQFRLLATAVEHTASDEKLRDLLKVPDQERLQRYLEHTHKHVLGPDNKPAFHTWHVLNKDGNLLADAPQDLPRKKNVVGVNFSFRDYYQGLRPHGDTGLDRVHVSRAAQFINDTRFKISLSAVVYAADGRSPLGVVCANLPTDATLSSLRLSPSPGNSSSERTSVLVGRRDPNLGTGEPPSALGDYVILVHPGYEKFQPGETAVSMPRAMLPLVPRLGHPELSLPLDEPSTAQTLHKNYEDPFGEKNPDYKGRRIAAFAQVGNTEMVVIIQQQREESADAWYWLLPGAVTMLAVGLFTTAFRRLRHRRAAPMQLLPQQAPTVSFAKTPPHLL